jgi:hypothetical protein
LYLPVYFKEQQLRHDLKENFQSPANCRDCGKIIEKDCQKAADSINFSGPIKVKCVRDPNRDSMTLSCNGVNPINFGFYTFNYHIHFKMNSKRGSY